MKIAKDDEKNIWEKRKRSEMADYKLWMTFYVYSKSYVITSLGEIAVYLFLHLRPQIHIRGSESVKASSLPKERWHWRHLPLGVMWDFEKASTFTARTHFVFLKISSIVFFVNSCKVMYSRFQNCSKNKITFGEKERLLRKKNDRN